MAVLIYLGPGVCRKSGKGAAVTSCCLIIWKSWNGVDLEGNPYKVWSNMLRQCGESSKGRLSIKTYLGQF